MVSFPPTPSVPPQLPSLPTQLHVLSFCLKTKAKTEYTRNKTGQDYKNKNQKNRQKTIRSKIVSKQSEMKQIVWKNTSEFIFGG